MSEKTIETRKLRDSRIQTRRSVMLPNGNDRGVKAVRVLSGNPAKGQPYRVELYGDGRQVKKLSQMGAGERMDAFKRMFGDGPLTRAYEKDCRCGNDPNADKAAAAMALSAIEGTKNGYIRFGRNAVNVDPSRKGYAIGSIQVCAAGRRGQLGYAAQERSLRKYDTCLQTGLNALRLVGQARKCEDLDDAQMDQVAKLGHDLPRFVNRAFGQVAKRPIQKKGADGKMRIVGEKEVRLAYRGAYTREHVEAYFRYAGNNASSAKAVNAMHGSIRQTGNAVSASIRGGKMDLEIV